MFEFYDICYTLYSVIGEYIDDTDVEMIDISSI